MTDFDQILDACLEDLASGASTLDECLVRHPEHAGQLKPLLESAVRLQKGRNVKPSAAFKARARANLTLHMHANPRRNTRAPFMLWKFSAGLAVTLLALLITGTAYAQSAFPGDVFYSWKLISERAWRAVSPDPIGTDIGIANRRIDEMNMYANDPVRRSQAWEGYREVVDRLESELDFETLNSLLPVIEIEPEVVETLDQPIATPTMTLTETATQEPEGTPIPLSPLPVPVNPVPKIIPTIQIPPPIR